MSEEKQLGVTKPLKLAPGKSKMSKMSAVMPKGIQKRKKSRIIRKGLKNFIEKAKKIEGIKEEKIMDESEGSTSQQQSVEKPSDNKDEKGVKDVVEQENEEMKQDVENGKEKEELQNQGAQIKENEPEATVQEELQKPEKPVEKAENLEPEATKNEEELPKNPIMKPSCEEQIVGVYNDVQEEPPKQLFSSFLYTDFGRCADTQFGDFTNKLADQVPLQDEKTGEIKEEDAEGNKRVDTEKGDEGPKDSSSGGA